MQDVLLAHYAFFDFSKHYLATHTVAKDFEVNENVLQDFKAFLTSKQIAYTDQELSAVGDWLKTSIKAELFTSVFGQQEGMKVRANYDPMIAKALTVLPQAAALEQTAERVDAQKQAAKSNIPSTM